MQFARENPCVANLPQIKVQDLEEVTEEVVTTTLRRGLNFYSTIQAHDGHWPGDCGGPMFLLPALVITLHITGALNVVLSIEHQREMCRYLCNHQVLGAYEWSGNNPLPPEVWLCPYILPIHPGQMSCHCRMVYLPMSYIYGKRLVGPITPTIISLRKELYIVPYQEVDWNKACNQCANEDLYYPHPLVQHILWASLQKVIEPIMGHWPGNKLREKALCNVMQHVHYEDENTRYICIGPVNKGYNRSQLWDTSFAVQAIISTNLGEEYGLTLRKVLEDCPGDLKFWYRHISKGAWPFSTADHGWPISDCTAEGLKAVLLLSKLPLETVGEPLDMVQLFDAVNVILSLQNADGGFATYELTRSYRWFEICGMYLSCNSSIDIVQEIIS
ncbi:hypothetical protein PVL29_012088 [Vitis rotundifolia]|uniref:Squalene cyclase N-terminal domain-containing protein n=1 Tax=Vitis rotundifolia TaxID=103349 RepID=A0AA38ZR15_VITRO|nr:hypothetical protein PVL29_012088 [Vitis rotundifolia]